MTPKSKQKELDYRDVEMRRVKMGVSYYRLGKPVKQYVNKAGEVKDRQRTTSGVTTNYSRERVTKVLKGKESSQPVLQDVMMVLDAIERGSAD